MTRAGVHEGWTGLTMLSARCPYIESAGGHAASTVLPGDLVTNCTASMVWRVQYLERANVAVLIAAGMTPGDRWKAGHCYRVHVSHLQHAPQHTHDSLFAELACTRAPEAVSEHDWDQIRTSGEPRGAR